MPNQTATLLFLDLDGVLITTPTWKPDELDSDGYSAFSKTCVENLNTLLGSAPFEIWLTSSRRTHKTLAQFNQIFAHRQIDQEIMGFLPVYQNCKNRRKELERFITEHNPSDYLIIDDDKSLNGLAPEMKQFLVLTELALGFNKPKLEEALQLLQRHNYR